MTKDPDELALTSTRLVLDDAEGAFGSSRFRIWDAGPLMQGVIMEQIAPSVAEALHQTAFNPYSQNVALEQDGIVWTLNALTTQAQSQVVEPCLRLHEVGLRKNGARLTVRGMTQQSLPFRELTASVREAGQHRFELRFRTPTAFKSAGEYQNIPSMRLVYQNLAMHYGQLFDGSHEVDQDMVEYLCAHTRLLRYRLGSQGFRIGRSLIPAFTGTLVVEVKGPPSIVGFAQLLFRFGTFAGVGIKTSMGMGGLALACPQGRKPVAQQNRGGA